MRTRHKTLGRGPTCRTVPPDSQVHRSGHWRGSPRRLADARPGAVPLSESPPSPLSLEARDVLTLISTPLTLNLLPTGRHLAIELTTHMTSLSPSSD
jgi:hypothetical protein